ncbi:MAG: hypothetical protein P8I95_01755 [Alphaproteobacteria bacterium]|jgi:hypothetical protein|nr:hypothetical protein [Alphaproteobacteria bacterium]
MQDNDFLAPVAPTPIVHCRHCRFWDAHMLSVPTRTPEGLCRRKAPQPAIVPEDTDTGTSWPRTFEDDWCGEGVPMDPA